MRHSHLVKPRSWAVTRRYVDLSGSIPPLAIGRRNPPISLVDKTPPRERVVVARLLWCGRRITRRCAPRPSGAAVEDAGVQLRLTAKLSNPLVCPSGVRIEVTPRCRQAQIIRVISIGCPSSTLRVSTRSRPAILSMIYSQFNVYLRGARCRSQNGVTAWQFDFPRQWWTLSD